MRCVAAALAPIQARGLTVLPYLDDWLIVPPMAEQAVRDTAVLLWHMNQLGLKVNYSKSSLTPGKKGDYLGMTLNSLLMRALLSRKRVENILETIGCLEKGYWDTASFSNCWVCWRQHPWWSPWVSFPYGPFKSGSTHFTWIPSGTEAGTSGYPGLTVEPWSLGGGEGIWSGGFS